jgi:transposase InsO family protein
LDKDENGKDKVIPWGPLYNMSREELLVLRKTLTELSDKNFIRVSKSPAGAPVLFVRKPGGGLRFCVDYRGLNAITRKDRYPLPLVTETLRILNGAKWFTKLDVRAAFHKIRIAEGEEWKTAFRTRYGLFEWQVCPFGLSGSPATFQRYINWTLREHLDEFCSAYVDDILIFSSESLEDHQTKVQTVLSKLLEAGLQLDIDKCEFEKQKVKYLGFILEAGKGISMDPAKVEAIQAWQTPTSTKAVRSFVGFANYYRDFIDGFTNVVLPLTKLTGKDVPFKWSEQCEESFRNLKKAFVSAPLLAQFDPDKETNVECDASKWSSGGVLSQYQPDGSLKPCAYYSKKHSPPECNYEIHDKEMLAIVRCLEEWDAELRSTKHFTILTDHKNLLHFQKARMLSERQMRWWDFLSRFSYTLQYRPGKLAEKPDALSRREQDLPQDDDDERRRFNCQQLVNIASTQTTESSLENLWKSALGNDKEYSQIKRAVEQNETKLPSTLNLKISISECDVNDGQLRFRDRIWVPNSEPLRTRMIQETHDSMANGHPGREQTTALLSRRFFWPDMIKDIRRFLRNCDICGRTKAWREKRWGLLKPLPVPTRIWRSISMDFITDLPPGEITGATFCMVITDRLGKGKIFIPLTKTDAQTVAWAFLRFFACRHGFPEDIVSDRGSQFVGLFWSRFCQLTGIKRKLSTAYHPETDGATERANQELEAYLRMFANFEQTNWEELLPCAELALNNRNSTTTGVSPFFLEHGYHVEPLNVQIEPRHGISKSPVQAAEEIVRKLQDAREWAQASMTAAQQDQEKHANRTRQPAEDFPVGSKVWLNLKNVATTRPSKKLDWRHAKYTVLQRINSHAYRLDVPPGIHNVFSVNLLRPAANDPLPSQTCDDTQPPAIQTVDGEGMFDIDQILRAKGQRGKRKALVKWTGYAQPTWEPVNALLDTEALIDFEKQFGSILSNDGPQIAERRRKVMSEAAPPEATRIHDLE